MPRGRPRKKSKNTSGLCKGRPRQKTPLSSDSEPEDCGVERGIHQDSLKVDFEREESEGEAVSEWDEDDAGLGLALEEMALKESAIGDDWEPTRLKKAVVKGSNRPKEYIKGPDVMNKSSRTQRRYRASMANQSKLPFVAIPRPSESAESLSVPSQIIPASRSASEVSDSNSTSDSDSESESEPDEHDNSRVSAGESDAGLETPESETDLEAWEEELDLAIQGGDNEEVLGWDQLRAKARQDLKKNIKTLPLTKINQLIIICNFATLLLKGSSRTQASEAVARQWKDGDGVWFARRIRALARHYQIFETLPAERRGGKWNAQSLLNNESVHSHARAWLTAQAAGKVTPKKFREALNTSIFPELNILLRKPISVRTARRWLVKLGWRWTRIRKGVYMDGHEREDVVTFRNHVFLPAMAQYERRMIKYDAGGNAQQPNLKEGERRIIAQFHDECCFHANDESSSAWLRAGEQPLRKKSRGRLIHVSDFINEEDGRLIIRDENGTVTQDARKIIFPGANGDAWWDCDQLIVQTRAAIEIFNNAHPDCQALFVFDNSSAHSSLPPDALKAFEMNNSNGGKQRRQQDTIIPESNPDPAKRGKPQSMTTASGEAKGLKDVLEERGFDIKKLKAKCSPVYPFESEGCCMARLLSQQDDFKNQTSMIEKLISDAGHLCIFLPKFHCELNPIEMYWGWCKYRYREVTKESFANAKAVAIQYLDACPVDVIRRFINRSWRFMSAYRKGLTGKAAEWAVRKQKGHRSVSDSAMMHLDAVLN